MACSLNTRKTQLVLFGQSNNYSDIDVKMNEPDLLRCWGSYIVSTAKTASNKFRALICSIKLLSSEVGLYFYKGNLCGIYLCYMILHWILLSCLVWSLPFPFGYVEMGIKDCWSFICCSPRTFTHCWKVAWNIVSLSGSGILCPQNTLLQPLT